MIRTSICLFFVFMVTSTATWNSRESNYFYLFVVLGLIWGGALLWSHRNNFVAPLVGLIFSLPLMILGIFLLGSRLFFIFENGGMEGPDGMGSPMAFLIGFVFEQIFCSLAGAVMVQTLVERLDTSRFKGITSGTSTGL